jgi:hypothetical protein
MTATPDTKLTPRSPARITVRQATSHADPTTAAINAHCARTAHSEGSGLFFLEAQPDVSGRTR